MPRKSILITGGAGFIGSNFVTKFIKNNPDIHVVNLDLMTYAAEITNLSKVINSEQHTLIKGDICNRKLVEQLFEKYDFSGVIHFAAESHVDNSITGPEAFIKTNIAGTFTLLDTARKFWMDEPFKPKKGYSDCKFHHISTDEVYGSLGNTGFFTEQTPYAPNSPYSASKASSDLIVRSYFHTYGMNVVTSNCSNNFGPGQHKEKLIPTIINNALSEMPIPIYGDGNNIRDWLYVKDHCSAIELVFKKGRAGETYNIGGDNEKTNIQIVKEICKKLDSIKPRRTGKYSDLITFVKDRPGHDKRYAIDSSKIKKELKWKPETSFEEAILKTISSIL
ncbi:dTDP-glucose 4,6-dehydratase [Halobacteriovorax marinus]|uniref:dTDP-glucose 4,6-dehydratase n=1 Tax=Halobacteriovorax marinus TaxID=97084 RepID=UPI000BC3490A|nr:dTDP-glucose 4,6-dehydratase [Halobacteriovorax marinus]ATH06726.1 dTDP-glucose 4,6-dehydratase [Halobacteriovorax marinus]